MKLDLKVAFPFMVQVIFLLLKLTGLVDWPWWGVMTPLELTFLFCIFAVLIAFFIGFVGHMLDKAKGE